MKPGLLAGLIVVVAVGMLAAATGTWMTVTVEGAVIDGVQLPSSEVRTSGVEQSPASIVAALLAFLTAFTVAIHGTIRGRSEAGGRASRLLAAALAAGCLVTAFLAVASAPGVEVVTLGDEPPVATGSAGPAALIAGAFAVVALTALLWRRSAAAVPVASSRQDPMSRYTVEAARGESLDAAAQTDEWTAAVLDDPEEPQP